MADLKAKDSEVSDYTTEQFKANFQVYLKKRRYDFGILDGFWSSVSRKAMQRYLWDLCDTRDMRFYSAAVDGVMAQR